MTKPTDDLETYLKISRISMPFEVKDDVRDVLEHILDSFEKGATKEEVIGVLEEYKTMSVSQPTYSALDSRKHKKYF